VATAATNGIVFRKIHIIEQYTPKVAPSLVMGLVAGVLSCAGNALAICAGKTTLL
jgi:hypothetical protein